MISRVFFSILFLSPAVFAAEGTKKLSAMCEQQLVDVVYDKLGRYDETFSVVGYKVVYTNLFTDLAVVRTSDEVEPRDVLVEITEGEKSCRVLYKDTIADGSVADIDEEMVELTRQPKLIASKHFELIGKIGTVTSGEIDPNVIGDACVIEVKTNNGPSIGLIIDQYECDGSEKIKEGAAITALVHKSDRIRRKDELGVLRQMFKFPKFYKVPFDQIK